MNLRDLRYLVALNDFKHFGRAASACFVSQPTLSTQIKKLEDELGIALVERTPRKVLLTEVGREIVTRARTILHEAEQIKVLARRSKNPELAMVRLGLFPTLGPYLLPHVVPKIRKAFPKLELFLTEEKTEIILQQLRDGHLDAGILALPVSDDQLHCDFLFEEPFVLAVPRHHRLSNRANMRSSELRNESLLLLDEGHCLRDQALEVCRLTGAKEKTEFRATSMETLRQMVAANSGITLLPILATKPPIAQSDNIKLIPFSSKAPSRRIAMIWRKSSALAEFLPKLANIIRSLPPRLLHP